MNKPLTTNEAMVLLSEAALLNEDIISLLNSCYADDRYCSLDSAESIIIGARYGTVLQASVEAALDYERAEAFLREVWHETTANEDFVTAC